MNDSAPPPILSLTYASMAARLSRPMDLSRSSYFSFSLIVSPLGCGAVCAGLDWFRCGPNSSRMPLERYVAQSDEWTVMLRGPLACRRPLWSVDVAALNVGVKTELAALNHCGLTAQIRGFSVVRIEVMSILT